jgi:hypothetical protein
MGMIEWLKAYKTPIAFISGILFILFLGMAGLPTYVGFSDSLGREAILINGSVGYGIPVYIVNSNTSSNNVSTNSVNADSMFPTYLGFGDSLGREAKLVGNNNGVYGIPIYLMNGQLASGTVTSILTGTGLIGGPITTTGTIGINYSIIANKTWVQEQLTTTSYLLNTTSVLKGTPLNINKGNLSYDDNKYGNITEATGALPIQLYVNFTNIDIFNYVHLKERYFGGSGHIINLEIYNYNSSSWDTHFTFSDQTGYVISTIYIDDNINHVSNGKVQVRLIHQGNGNPSHLLSIDSLYITKGIQSFSTSSGTVTSITTGYGLLGGTIMTAGTVSADFSIIANKSWVALQGYLTAEVDGSTSNEIQNIITNKGLQRDGSNNFGIMNCGNAQILVYNTTLSSWGCKNQSTSTGSGTVSSITAGTGLTGGTITTIGTIALNQTYTEKLAHRTPSAVLFDYTGAELSNITNVYSDRNVTTLFTYNNSQLMNIYKIDSILGNKNITFVYNGTTLMEVVYS